MQIQVKLTDVFQALTDQTRLRIVHLLYKSRDQICLCEFVESLNDSESNISRHLKILRGAGLLKSIKDGRWVYHEASEDLPFHSKVYDLISEMSPVDKTFENDLKVFRNVIKQRKQGRCTGPETAIQSSAQRTA